MDNCKVKISSYFVKPYPLIITVINKCLYYVKDLTDFPAMVWGAGEGWGMVVGVGWVGLGRWFGWGRGSRGRSFGI